MENRKLLRVALIAVMAVALAAPLALKGQEAEPPDEEFVPLMGMGPGGPPPEAQPSGAPGLREKWRGMDRTRREARRERAWERMKQEDPEHYQRLERIKALAKEYRETESESRKKEIEKELRPLVEKELKIQHEKNKERVKKLEAKLKQMKKVLKQREEHWNEVVDYTVKEITGQNDYLHVMPGRRMRRR